MELRQLKMFSGIRIAAFVVAAFVCLFAAFIPGGAGAAQWSGQFPLSSSQKVNSSQLVFLPDGSSTMVWNRQDGIVEVANRTAGGEFEIADEFVGRPSDYFAATDLTSNATGTTAVLTSSANQDRRMLQVRVRPPGGDFGDPINVAISEGYIGNSQVGIGPNGTLVVTWSETSADNTTTNIFAWVMDPAGDSSTTTRLGQAQDYSVTVLAATGPDGTTTALWGGADAANMVIHSRTRPPGGSFGPAEELDPGADLTDYPKLFVDSTGRSSIYWVSDGFHYADREAGGPWGAVQTAPDGDGAQSGFDVSSLPDGTTLAAWSKNGRIIVSKRAPGGSFPTSQEISGSGSHDPSVTMLADGSSTVIWRGPVDPQNLSQYLIEGSYGDSSGNFATPSEIGETTADEGGISLGSGVGGTTAFWVAGEPVPNQIGYFDRTPTGFTDPTTFSGSPGVATSPLVASNAGIATTVWQLAGAVSPSVEQGSDYLTDTSYPAGGTALSGNATDPDLDSRGSFDQGATAAVWVRNQQSKEYIQGSIGGEGPLATPVTLGQPLLENDPQPAVAIGSQGLATAAWRSKEIGKFLSQPFQVLETIDFNASGKSGSPSVVSAPDGEPIGAIDVASGRLNATTAIVWEGGGFGNQIRAAVRRPGQGYSSAVSVSTSTGENEHPMVAIGSKGEVFVAWLDAVRNRVRFAVSRSGSDFSEPVSPPDGAAVGAPQITADPDGGFELAWLGPDGKVRVASGSEVPTGTRVVSGSSTAASGPAIDTNNFGDTALAWRTTEGDIDAAMGTESGAFDPAVKLSSTPTAVGVPDIAVDDGGMVQVVWADQSGVVLGAVGYGQTQDCGALRGIAFKGLGRKGGRQVIRFRTSSPGRLTLASNKALKPAKVRSTGKSVATVPLRLKRAASRKLKRKGRLTVTAKVTFQTSCSCQPATRKYKLKLKLKLKRRSATR